MIIQLHTPNGIIKLDTEKNSEAEFAKYNLDKAEYIKPTIEERLSKLENDITTLESKIDKRII